MQTYTVYEPRPALEDIEERSTSLVFVKEGFSLLAFLVPLVWLLINRLWIASALYAGAMIILSGSVMALGGSENVASWATLFVNLVIGFEARDILRQSLEGRGYVLRAVVSGRNLAECEQRFLQEWLPDARLDQARLATSMNPADGDAKRSYKEPVIGMFPAHGG